MIEIQTNELHLWCVYDEEIRNTDLIQSYQELLNSDEKARWQRYKFPVHQHQFLITRALVRTVLAEYLGIEDSSTVNFEKNEYGKPALVSSENQRGLRFNLSHTKGIVVLALGLENDLGVDIEAVDRKTELIKLAERYFSPAEAMSLINLPVAQQSERFFDLWTLKEAYIKACGKGLAIPLDDFSFSFKEDKVSIAFNRGLVDKPEDWLFSQFLIEDKYQLALAVKGGQGNQKRLTCYSGVPLEGFEEIDLVSKRTS